jgi:predicted RNase H-like HicB family nuclease
MNNQTLLKAKELAHRPYQLRTFLDETTDDEPVYVAVIPELPGCVAHGDTPEEAKQNILTAKVDFIYFLLEDGLNVPEPKLLHNSIRIDMTDYRGQLEDNDTQSSQAHGKMLPT